jgi:hypothetical protein
METRMAVDYPSIAGKKNLLWHTMGKNTPLTQYVLDVLS